MSCQDVLDRVAPYLDHELGPAERELLERHLDGCASCQALAEKIAEQELRPPPVADAVAARMGAPDFWSAMDTRLAAAIDARTNAPRVSAPRVVTLSWRTAFALAAAFVLAILWGAHAHHEVLVARAESESLARQLERAERLADPTPVGTATLPAPVVNGPTSTDDLELAGYTPHRGTF
jgi:anti-sigma factor RsiW